MVERSVRAWRTCKMGEVSCAVHITEVLASKYVWPTRVVTPYFLRPSGSMPSSPSQNKFTSVLHQRLNQSRRRGSKPNRSLNRRATKTTV